MEITLRPGETLKISFADAEDNSVDGDLFVEYGEEHISINTEWPDDQGRTNEIYLVTWGRRFVLIHPDTNSVWWGPKQPDLICSIDENRRDWVDEEISRDSTIFTENEKNLVDILTVLPEGVRWQEIDSQFGFIDSSVEPVSADIDPSPVV